MSDLNKDELEALIKQLIPEMRELRREVTQINKAMGYRVTKDTTEKPSIQDQIRLSIIQKGRANRPS